jgi:ribosomal protein S18 acetylase RimI-like enzyme
MATDSIELAWRGPLSDAEMLELVDSYGGQSEVGWWTRIQPHSLGWVTARADDRLVGFVNVAWDGGDHAFLLDTRVHPGFRRRGLGTRIVNVAVTEAKRAGCEWIEVDFDDTDGLAAFYFDACGFRATNAALIRLFDLP